MIYRREALAPGLYLVGTPIGAARDITLRALDVLASADVLAAEDTRTLRKLLTLHSIPLEGRRVLAYHDHSGLSVRGRLAEEIAEGASVAYASEAGMPLIADPGFALARAVQEAGGNVTAVPGPSAVLTALAVAGLPTDRFHFAGFLPTGEAARRRALAELRELSATLVVYEAPGRVAALLASASATLGPGRQGAICRELTKRFEEVRRGTLEELATSARDTPPKGECVVLIDRSAGEGPKAEDVEMALREALGKMSLIEASQAVAGSCGMPRRDVYQMARARKGR